MGDQLRELYKSSGESGYVRPVFRDNIDKAKSYYKRYTGFILENLPRNPAKILDVGCGEGWSTLVLRENGHDAHGLDMQPGPVEANQFDPDLPYISGDTRHLPLDDESFDVIAMHQVLGYIRVSQMA